jgi:hydrogenase expression/formation protein HypC
MCLALPGRVIEVGSLNGLRMATVDFGGTRRSICLDCTPEADVGTFVIVHAGFAIAILDEAEATATTALLAEALAAPDEERS